jgi:tetratricopeptide (TPR) repeat protein
VRTALLVEYYRRLPERKEDEEPEAWAVRLQEGLEGFRHEIGARYTEATLQRVLTFPVAESRRAAVLALGLLGTPPINKSVAARLHDGDSQVRQMASDALWAIWFRGEAPAHAQDLQRILRIRNAAKALEAYAALIEKAPQFAEAFNQRAILYFRLGEFQKSIADCEATLKLNPVHFGAQAGMAQCYMKLGKPKHALKHCKAALRINPNMDGVHEMIRTLEDVLEGGSERDDKK